PTNPGASTSTDSLNDTNDLHNPTAHRIPRARPDELQGLLADTHSDAEAERMSLHSNPGLRRKRTKRKKKDKKITFWGYDLFGHKPPPIQLPESDDEYGNGHGHGNRGIGPTTPTRTSSLTFDSDAAPLDSSAIVAAAFRAGEREADNPDDAFAEGEEERRREKAERREKRRQRKELKRVAKAIALAEAEHGESFEGFPGSGNGPREEFGPFVRGSQREYEEDGDEDADFDGGLYNRTTHTVASSSRSGSDSRSRTSASRSQQSQNGEQELRPPTFGGSSSLEPNKKPKSKSTSRSSRSAASRSNTSGSTSQSPSLPSPASATFPGIDALGLAAAPTPRSKLNLNALQGAENDFDGSQGLTVADIPKPKPTSSPGMNRFPSTGLRGGGGGFPSTGFGPGRSSNARSGAFLATRGGAEEEEE
ncbi:hypothetical protein H0H93_001591, partial [Arthromyces matolae]